MKLDQSLLQSAIESSKAEQAKPKRRRGHNPEEPKIKMAFDHKTGEFNMPLCDDNPSERMLWTHFKVCKRVTGCWWWEGYVDRDEPKLCSHVHDNPSEDLMKVLTGSPIIPQLWKTRCLLGDFREFKNGTVCLTFYEIGNPFDLFIHREMVVKEKVVQPELF